MSIGSELFYKRNNTKSKSRKRFSRLVLCTCFAVFLLAWEVSFETASVFVAASAVPISKSKAFTTAIFDSDWEIIETYAHDSSSFTQGLEVHPSSVTAGTCETSSSSETCTANAASQRDDENKAIEERILVTESTGMRGDSLLRIWDLVTGTVQQETKMDSHLFGEGSTFFVDDEGNDKIAVLTYQEDTILVYDAHTLQLLDTIRPWPSSTTTNEGWGIAFDPFSKLFIVTDGSEYLHFWNTNFEQAREKIPVVIQELIATTPDGSSQVIIPQDSSAPDFRVTRLNELEWDASTQTVLANRWGEAVVVRIDPTTGIVTRVYNFWNVQHKHTQDKTEHNEERASKHPNEDVFNGIAIVPNTDGKEWLVTGKWWPQLYRIRIQE